jgi:hypothetical protein
MFIARSVARIRRARLLFLAAGLAPTVALVAWAVHVRSETYRAQIQARWQEAIGLPIVVGRIEHPRPGVTRGHDCMLPPAAGKPAVALPLVEIESSADEDRIRIPRLACDGGTAAIAIDLAGRWLVDDIRFRRACVVEIGGFSWGDALPHEHDNPGASPASLRVECVKHDASRAIRIVRRDTTEDEVRIVRHPRDPSGATKTYDVNATITNPIPVAILASLAGSHTVGLTSAGPHATLTGSLVASCTDDGWQSEARGRITGIDLAAAAATVGDRASGTASLDISRLNVTGGRVRDALAEVTVSAGHVDRRLFDRIVLALGARPGAAAARLPPTEPLSFDVAACIIAIGPHGVQVQPTPRVPGGIATTRGEVLLAAPGGPVTADRIAWLLSSPGTTFGPTAGPGAWLMSVLPPLAPQTAPNQGDRRF